MFPIKCLHLRKFELKPASLNTALSDEHTIEIQDFSAFAHHRSQGDDEGIGTIVEDFLQMFEYYLERHTPTQTAPGSENSLKALIDRVKYEV